LIIGPAGAAAVVELATGAVAAGEAGATAPTTEAAVEPGLEVEGALLAAVSVRPTPQAAMEAVNIRAPAARRNRREVVLRMGPLSTVPMRDINRSEK